MTVEDNLNQTLTKSWDIFKKQYVTLILGTLAAVFLMIFIITIPPLVFGIYFMCSKAAKGKKAEISDIFRGFDYFFTSWGMFILAFIAIFIGLILLVLPGIFLMIMFQYAVAIAITEKKGAVKSLSRSYEIAKKNFSFSLMLWIIVAIINGIGTALRVGFLVSIPFTILGICVATNKLAGKKK